MSDEKPKDFMDPNQLVRDPCCPFSKRALYWHILQRFPLEFQNKLI